MKILFYSVDKHISVGSYRIWSHDLNKYMLECGFDSSQNIVPDINNNEQLQKADVIIFPKNVTEEGVNLIRKTYPDKLLGATNTAADAPKLNCDFVIVGSLEEKASLSQYENVFYFPLIERMYQPEEMYKKHEQKDNLVIGFHGNYSHISKLGLQNKAILTAIKEFSEEQKVILKIITTPEAQLPSINNLPRWTTTIKTWDYNTIINDLIECDIGIVPNVGYLSLNDLSNPEKNHNKGYFPSDYLIRLKNKSNAGRCFVFHQLGIPVITDLTPSNFHIMGSGECGHIVSNRQGWLNAFRDLADHKKRQTIADRAKEEFDRLYNPHDWAKKLYKQIEGIKR